MLSRPYYNEADIRKKQIDTLKIFNDNVVEVKENSEYRIDFSTTSGHQMSLEVILGAEFPTEKPLILINPIVTHPWVAENSNMVMNAPGLLSYTIYSDLGRVVQAIVREFTKSQFVMDNVERTNAMSPTNVGSLVFPELNELSIEDLQELCENQDLQDRFLETSPQLVKLDRAIEETLSNIDIIAKDNLSKQQILDNFKTDIINRITMIVQLKSNYEDLNKKHQKLCEAYDPSKIKDCLQDAASKADEEADMIAEQFLSGSMSVEDFVKQYAEKRALGQSRRTRGERLAHQLDQLNRAAY